MNIEELEKYAGLRGFNLGQGEKDYYQNLILFILYGKFSKELIFKGGTALSKCYGLNRFSEDLDFTVSEKNDFVSIIEKRLEDFKIKYHTKNFINSDISQKCKVKIQGPLYKGTERSECSITLDFSFRESVILEPNVVVIAHHMDIIPAFDVYVMKEEEIFAEKIRAILSRESARDLYDLSFLLKRGTMVNISIVEKKLEWNQIKFNKPDFLKKLHALKPIWQSELSSLVKNVPSFEECFAIAKHWAESPK